MQDEATGLGRGERCWGQGTWQGRGTVAMPCSHRGRCSAALKSTAPTRLGLKSRPLWSLAPNLPPQALVTPQPSSGARFLPSSLSGTTQVSSKYNRVSFSYENPRGKKGPQ